MVACFVLILVLQSFPTPVVDRSWQGARVAATREPAQQPSSFATPQPQPGAEAEPLVPRQGPQQAGRPAAVDSFLTPSSQLHEFFEPTAPTATELAASDEVGEVVNLHRRAAPVRAAEPYVVLGVATAPRNYGHRAWIRETWMTLPNVVARSRCSTSTSPPSPTSADAAPSARSTASAPR